MELFYSPLRLILLTVLVIAVAIQMSYWLRYYLRAVLYDNNKNTSHKEAVSVVVCARNEAANLRKHLPSLLKQNHPSYEVIVVNDCSEDDSYMILSQMKNEFPHLKISTINRDQRFRHNKKLAQLIGIKAASNELLLLTDADCVPESDAWLSTMTKPLTEGAELVLGYGGYQPASGLLNKYIRYETMFIAMQYTGMALRGKPYMGVGRNLAYRRSLFLTNSGYSNHYHLDSGDDDLFVNANANSSNTAVVLVTEAHTRSIPAAGVREYIRQKKRHLSTAAYYKKSDKVRLILEPLSRTGMYIIAAVLLPSLFIWKITVPLIAMPLISRLAIIRMAMNRFNEKKFLLFSLLFDIFSPFINILLFISNFGKKAGRTE